ncbi:isoprenoid synthase domain-containing protein [Armillaria mellea]|nr:isoprenoid synthase domain-containing protein [Armillaria mellea]
MKHSDTISYTAKCASAGRGVLSWVSSSASLGGRLPTFKKKRPQDASDVIQSFLHHFDVTNLPSVLDSTFQNLCFAEAERRGYSVDLLTPSLVSGVQIVASAYHFLENTDVKVHIAPLTMFVVYLDDVYPDGPDLLIGVPNFTKLFGSSQKQPNKILNDFADLLYESHRHFGEVDADVIIHSFLRFVTGLILEAQSMSEPTKKVDKYILFLRGLSGISEAYAIFIFPKELPFNLDMQALPYLCQFINFANDILSFYKEECAGETNNLISLLADARGEPKCRVLRSVAVECIQTHKKALSILSPDEGVRRAYEEFVKGYLAFHLGAERYRLSELNLYL